MTEEGERERERVRGHMTAQQRGRTGFRGASFKLTPMGVLMVPMLTENDKDP